MSKDEKLQFFLGLGCYIAVIFKNVEDNINKRENEDLNFKFETFFTAQIQNLPRLVTG